MKKCTKCGKHHDESCRGFVCRECRNKNLRNYRAITENKSTLKYEKTKKGFLMRMYRNMESRINGIQKEKHHLYKNKDILSREDFYKWAENSLDFHKLFAIWEKSNYDRKITPSVDRIDSLKGYSIDNMEWVTHSENSRRGAISRHKKAYEKHN